jgi:phosphatidylglycerophosphatase A
MALSSTFSTKLATLFSIGRVPLVPGTIASAAALPVGWWLAVVGGWMTLLIAAGVITLLGIWACGRQAKLAGMADPTECVIDEAAGQWFALVPVAYAGKLYTVFALALAFVLFRALDILKPWPISRLERLPGGFGIMADDVLAGLVAGGLVAAAYSWHIIEYITGHITK